MKIFLYVIICATFLSCGNSNKVELTNEDALSIIKDKYIAYMGCYGPVRKETNTTFVKNDTYLAQFREVEKAGYIKVSQRQVKANNGWATVYQWTRNDAAGELYNPQDDTYLLAQFSIDEILGIALNEEAKTATVKYAYKLNPTAFMTIAVNNGKCKTGTFTHEMEFIKYDTGWQVRE